MISHNKPEMHTSTICLFIFFSLMLMVHNIIQSLEASIFHFTGKARDGLIWSTSF